MLRVLWTHSVEGERPGLLLGDGLVLFHFHATPTNGKSDATETTALDLDGRELWSRPGLTGLLALPGNRFLALTPDGGPVVLDAGGAVVHRRASGGWLFRRRVAGRVTDAVRHGGLLLLAGERRVWATDFDLDPLWDVAWPDDRGPSIDCLVGDALYWVRGAEVRWLDRAGRSGVLAGVPEDLAADAMDRYERATGGSALVGGFVRVEGNEGYVPFRRGDRPLISHWRVSFDAARGAFFLANAMAPHLVACLDRSGQPLWCEYLSPGCCGGPPAALPDGRYVASSGCGGVLSWLDAGGNVLFQSRPHDGVGLATALSSEVRVLPDGRVLAEGGPGVVAYGADGQRLWVFEESFLRYDCDPGRGLLVGCYWRNTTPAQPNRSYLVCAGGL